MVRNLKALGLAFVAVFAMSALTASAAQAIPTLTTGVTGVSHAHTDLIGEQYAKTGGNIFTENHFEAFGTKISCSNVTYTATSDGTESELTVTPTYKHCGKPDANHALVTPTTVNMNGCDYKFTPVHTTGGAGSDYEGNIDLVCPQGVAGVTLDVFGSGTPTAHSSTECGITVTAGQELGPVTYQTVAGAPDDVTVTVNVSGVHFTRTGLCLLDGKGATGLAKFTSNVTLTDKVSKNDVWLSD